MAKCNCWRACCGSCVIVTTALIITLIVTQNHSNGDGGGGSGGGNIPSGPWYSVYLSWSASNVPLLSRGDGAALGTPMPLLWWASDTHLWAYDPAGKACYSTVDGSQWAATPAVAPPNLTDTRYSTAAYLNGQAWVVGSDGAIWASTPDCTHWNSTGKMPWTASKAFWHDATLMAVGHGMFLHGLAYGGGSVPYSPIFPQDTCAGTLYYTRAQNGTKWTSFSLPYKQSDCHLTLSSDANSLYLYARDDYGDMYSLNFADGATYFTEASSYAGTVHAHVVQLTNVTSLVSASDVFLSATASAQDDITDSVYYSAANLQSSSSGNLSNDRYQPGPYAPRYDQQLVPLPWNGNVAFCGGFTQPKKQGTQYTDVWFG